MKNARRVLIVGEPDGVESLFRDEHKGSYQFTYCARDNRSGVFPKDAPGYDWVLIKGEALAGDKKDLIQSLDAMGSLADEPQLRLMQRCGVEWQQDGTLQLRCCMQSSDRPPHPVQEAQPDQYDQGYVFEFHAPVKRTG